MLPCCGHTFSEIGLFKSLVLYMNPCWGHILSENHISKSKFQVAMLPCWLHISSKSFCLKCLFSPARETHFQKSGFDLRFEVSMLSCLGTDLQKPDLSKLLKACIFKQFCPKAVLRCLLPCQGHFLFRKAAKSAACVRLDVVPDHSECMQTSVCADVCVCRRLYSGRGIL